MLGKIVRKFFSNFRKIPLRAIEKLTIAEEEYLIESGWIRDTSYVKGSIYWVPPKGYTLCVTRRYTHGHAVNSQKYYDNKCQKQQ